MTNLPAHSPLGASSAYRWLHCPGSVTLSQGVADFESEHASLGTNAHALAAICLKGHTDAWEHIGQVTVEGHTFAVDKEMADAVQVYLDAVRTTHPDRDQGNSWIERSFHCPSIHQYFYGTADFVHYDEANRTLHVWDYKHGAGIVVEVEDNPQLMYYAIGALEDLGLWETLGPTGKVCLYIAQPRGFHYDGPVRCWETTAEDLLVWLEETLISAMDIALTSDALNSGEHCRFCPARSRACPQLVDDMEELENLMQAIEKQGAPELTNEQVARFLDLSEIAKIVAKSVKETATQRIGAGKEIPGWKLSAARANRTWKDDAEKEIVAKFGEDAYTERTLKSPAQIDGLPEGKKITSRFAFKPDAGLTITRSSDARPAISQATKSLFKPVVKKGK